MRWGAWMDGTGMLALASPIAGPNQIIYISYPSGKVSPVTRDTNAYTDLSVSIDGHAITTVESQLLNKTYVLPDERQQFPDPGISN